MTNLPGSENAHVPAEAQGGGPRGSSMNAALVALGLALLMVGAALAYAPLLRPWGHFAGTPPALNTLSPEDRASLTVYWWDSTNTFCGPFPAIWPAVVLLIAVPLLMTTARRRASAARWWTAFGMVAAGCGFATVVLAVADFVERSDFSDSNWVYAADRGTMVIALSGYALLFAGILPLARAGDMLHSA